MKTKILSTLTAATICACACIGASPVPARIVQEGNDTVTIGVASSFEDMNILTDTEASYEYGWIYNMVYDRLFTIGDDGRLIPGLAISCELHSDFEGTDIFIDDYFLPNTATYNYKSPLTQAHAELSYPEWMYNTDFKMYMNPYDFLFFNRDGNGYSYLRFTLREDAKFSDGDPVTSEAIRDYIALCYSQSEESVVKKIWSTVVDIYVESDTVFELYFSISSYTHGFIDFLYEIASPYGGIAKYNEDQIICSGPYCFEESEYGVTLRQNENWYGKPVNTQTVRFVPAFSDEYINDVDILQISNYQNIHSFEYGYPDVSITKVATDPLVCLYNVDNEILSDERMRKALSLAVGYNEPSDMFLDFLLPVSNGYWTLTQIEKSAEGALSLVYESGWVWDVEFDLILSAKDGSEVLNLASYIKESLGAIGIKVNISQMYESDYKNAIQSGNYDIALSYIDLNDPDSAYKAFYPTYDYTLDEALDYTILSATTKTFLTMQYYDQKLAYENALFMNFGWNFQAFAQHDYISGVNYFDYKGYGDYDPIYGLSDANLVDFRWVEKQA